MFVDKTDKVVSIIPDRVLLTEGIKAQVAKEMAKELNPLHIDVKQIITLYRECGFSATTLNPYPAKMANFMEAFWSDKEDFLLSIKKEDKREEHVESKLQAMIVFDLVQRMFIPTLLVKYVSYTAMEAYYNFMASLITMGAINWSTLHAVTTVRYRAGEGTAENTMMGRWCDLYSSRRILQWKYLIGMLHRPSHFDTRNALDNLEPSYNANAGVGVFPHKDQDFVKEPSIMGIKVLQRGAELQRSSDYFDGQDQISSPILKDCTLYRELLQNVALELKQFIEFDGSLARSDLFRFNDPESCLQPDSVAEQYLMAYCENGSFDGVVRTPVVRDRDGEVEDFPYIEHLKEACNDILDAVLRY